MQHVPFWRKSSGNALQQEVSCQSQPSHTTAATFMTIELASPPTSPTMGPLPRNEEEPANEGSPLFDKPGDGLWKESTGPARASRRCRTTFSILIIVLVLLVTTWWLGHGRSLDKTRAVNVAFVGNSMFYFNDFPRFLQVLAGEDLIGHQDSCLHGGGSIPSLLMEGNSMYPQFATPKAILSSPSKKYNRTIYDYGACTPTQLMLGIDPRLDDPGYAQPSNRSEGNLNPCREDQFYFDWATQHYANSGTSWDFVIINDNTRNPARFSTRARSIEFLVQFWVPLLQATGATPVFLWTHAYSIPNTSRVDMTGLDNVANFTSLTYAGYKSYVEVLAPHLAKNQQARIAPSGLAFLAVHEEYEEMWHSLFHNADHLHASPSGSFLQGLCVFYTLFGYLPPRHHAVRANMTSLWTTARMMQHAWEPPNPIPTQEQAEYLYDVAERILVHGYRPASFIDYQHGESAYDPP